MKKSELKYLIKETLLQETKLDNETYNYMNGLVTIKDLDNFKKLAKSIYKELYDEDFEQDQILLFFERVIVKSI